MASQPGYFDPGGSGQGVSSELQSKDLPSKRLLGKGLSSIGYETELDGRTFARKDFVGVPIGIFKKEAIKLVGLNDHPNVVKTHGLTVDKMSCSLVLEYMDDDFLAVLQKRKRYKGRLARTGSGNQSELSRPQPFELPEALDLMLQIARGMEYLHEQGILHGDLKTKNVLVAYVKDGDKNVPSLKVADFGLVRTKRKSMSFVSRQARKLDMVRWKAPEKLDMLLLEDKDETSSESGSDSDEECTGSSSVSNVLLSTDVYSFAVMCFQILTGDDPYPDQNWKELVTKIVSDELRPNLPSACPPSLRDLLVLCWSKVPAERPTFTVIRRKLEHLQDITQTEKFADLTALERRSVIPRMVPNQPPMLAVPSAPMGNMISPPGILGKVVNAVGEVMARLLGKPTHETPHAGSSSTEMEPSSKRLELESGPLSTTENERETLHVGSSLAEMELSSKRLKLVSRTPSIRTNENEIPTYEISTGLNPEHLGVDDNAILESEYILESKQQVFLSYSSGQKDFVEQLCVDLERCNRFPFFDKLRDRFLIGEKFPLVIFNAIEQCQVGIVVLSEEFFMRNKWSMFELNAMVRPSKKANSNIKIVPVFYFISREDFQNPNNLNRWVTQWKKWASYDNRINVEEWIQAIRGLVPINSIETKEGVGDVEIRKIIVEVVCTLVPCATRGDDSHVQGQARICKVIQEKIDKVSANLRVCIVGLYGVGGMGKTTISKALCNDLFPKFQGKVCHVEMGSTTEMHSLQKALKILTSIRHDIIDDLDNCGQAYVYLKKKLRSEPVFLVLDNVQDDYRCIQAAKIYLSASYGPGSVVLVVARSLGVLKKLNLEESNCLEMPELEEDEARSLFLNCANLPSGYQVDEALINQCTERCLFIKSYDRKEYYHPLALKVLGQQLGCNPKQWAQQLKGRQTFNQREDILHPVFSILRTSFDSLHLEHQVIFMDLALFATSEFDDQDFKLSRRDWLCMVHEIEVEDMNNTLQVLKRRSLVQELSDDFTKIGMHDLWIEFAIAEATAQNSGDRRWVYQRDAKKGALRRRGRWREEVERMVFLDDGWKALEGLNLNDFVNVEVLKVATLMLNSTSSCEELDVDLSGLKHLKSLVLTTPGMKVRADGLSSLTNLAHLVWATPGFSPCLDEIGHLQNLQFLALSDCPDIQVLDFTELKFLQSVRIKGFPDLTAVRGLSSRLSTLRVLGIACCESLRVCLGLGELHALEVLCLWGCVKLEELPWLGRLTKLVELDIQECKSVSAVPGLSDLVSLELFIATGCLKLATLPDLVKLTKLRVLDIRECPVQGLSGLDGLVVLTTLRASLGKIYSGEAQPVFPKHSRLEVLDIRGWNRPILSTIATLVMLETLVLRDCTGDPVVPDLQSLARLKSVCLYECEYQDLSGLSSSTELEELVIRGCGNLESLPGFGRLTKLSGLRIMGCTNLRNWPWSEPGLCSSLQNLAVDGFSLTGIVPYLETMTGIRELHLHGQGWHSHSIPSLACLYPNLESLRIFRFPTMEVLDLIHFPRLKELWLYRCKAVKTLTCSRPLTTLTELEVVGCSSLIELQDLSTFPRLEKLKLNQCRALRRLTSSRPLTCLRIIDVTGCSVEMPDRSKFPKLQEFHAGDAEVDDDEDDIRLVPDDAADQKMHHEQMSARWLFAML